MNNSLAFKHYILNIAYQKCFSDVWLESSKNSDLGCKTIWNLHAVYSEKSTFRINSISFLLIIKVVPGISGSLTMQQE